MSEAIDIEATPQNQNQAVILPGNGPREVATRNSLMALTLEQVRARLDFVKQVMKENMREGTDYGKIPGTGEKPCLMQPGAQKLLLTFQLREQVKKEVLREIPHMTIPGHREYEFTVTVFPAGGRIDDGWDGVGTCSTFESKYRYRKATRKCPDCGAEAIIAGKEEFGGGFICWKKKGGCGAKFHDDHPAIISQSVEDVENEDPADCWNTVRKMAFKRALVAAAINATNTSELWTQDLEDQDPPGAGGKAKTAQNAPGPKKGVSTPSGGAKTPGTPSREAQPPAKSPPVRQAQPAIFPDSQSRERMIAMFEECRDLAREYFEKLGYLLPTERLEDLPLQYVPCTKRQAEALNAAITDFGNGAEARRAHPPNALPDPEPQEKKKAPPKKSQAPESAPKELPKTTQAAKEKNPEWFWGVICPIPRKGEKRDAYLKKPDTIKSLYDAMKGGDEEAQKRLWGFARHWNPEPREWNGRTYPVSKEDLTFREALDDFCDWHDKQEINKPGQGELLGAGELPEEDDVPF